MTVPWDLASTTMLLWLEGATQVFVALHSWDGGQPPQVPPQPSPPHVLPVQSALQCCGAPDVPALLEELVDAPELVDVPELEAVDHDPALLDDDPAWLPDAPLADHVPEFVASLPAGGPFWLEEHAPAPIAAVAPNAHMIDLRIPIAAPHRLDVLVSGDVGRAKSGSLRCLRREARAKSSRLSRNARLTVLASRSP